MYSRNQHYDADDDPAREVDISRYVTPLHDEPDYDDYPEYANHFEEDDDELPLGDVPPVYERENTEGIVHNGRYYAPIESHEDYDVYQTEAEPAFDDTTTNKTEYGWKTAPSKRNKMDDDDEEPVQALPRFTAETTNKETYLPHIVKKQSAIKQATPVSKAPFYDETSHKANYTPKSAIKPTKQRPKTHLGPGDNSFNNDTVNKTTYVPIAAERPSRYQANDHLGVGGEFFAKTTNADNFQRHQGLKKPQRRRPSGPKIMPGLMDDVTTTRQVYTPKKAEKDCVAAKILAAHKNNKLAGTHFTSQGHLMIPMSSALKAGAKASQFKRDSDEEYFNPAGDLQKTGPKSPKPNFDIYEVSSHGRYTPPPIVFSPFAGIQAHPTIDSPVAANYGQMEHVLSTRKRPTAHNVITHPNQLYHGFPIAR